jgi:hypothetical protein
VCLGGVFGLLAGFFFRLLRGRAAAGCFRARDRMRLLDKLVFAARLGLLRDMNYYEMR